MVEDLFAPAYGAHPDSLVLLSDRPVSESGQKDLLDRAAEASALAALVRASRSAAPFTLAVFADWGMGKSSLLSQMAAELRSSGDVEVVWFNAWLARGGQGLEALVKAVLDRLDRKSLRRLARAVSGESATASWLRVLARGLAGTFALHHLVDGIWEKLEVDARTRNDAQSLLRSALAEWTGTDSAAGPRRTIVVFVDDLDRCPAETIISVSSAIKQFLNVPGLVFVVACDQAVLEAAAPGSEPVTAGALAGRRFLEKVIQASYAIPPPTDAQVAELVSGYACEAGATALFRGPVGEALVRHVGRNPRRIKRLINSFVIEYHLDPEWQRLGPEALVRVALMQDFYPDFHRLLSITGELDPIDAFGGYLAVLRARKHGMPPAGEERERAERALSENGIRGAGEVTGADVVEVERNLPEQFRALARDRTFVSLVEYLIDLPAGEQLRLKLRRSSDQRAPVGAFAYQEPTVVPGYPPGPAPSFTSSAPDLTGLKVLRIRSGGAGGSLDLASHGASVAWATGFEEAVDRLRHEPPDVIITNLQRDGSADGGFEDVAALKAHGYSGPLIVYTGYVTPARRERADQLGVKISADPDDLFRWLTDVASNPVARLVPGAASDMHGLRLLWLTPHGEGPIQWNFESRGAQVTIVDTADAAVSAVLSERPDVFVVSGVRAAAEHVDFVRRTGFYTGPVVIYTSRVSPDRRELAHNLAAEITDDATDLAETLVRAAADRARGPIQSPHTVNAEAFDDYERLARSAQRLQETGEIDRAEQQWNSASYLAQMNRDTLGMLRAKVMRAEISVGRRRYSLAIGRYNQAIADGATEHLDPNLVARMYRGLATAYAALGDDTHADEARDALADYQSRRNAAA